MLVLTRRQGEKIHLGDDITVTLVRIDGNKVRIGIDAPEGVDIRRAELVERITGKKSSMHCHDLLLSTR